MRYIVQGVKAHDSSPNIRPRIPTSFHRRRRHTPSCHLHSLTHSLHKHFRRHTPNHYHHSQSLYRRT